MDRTTVGEQARCCTWLEGTACLSTAALWCSMLLQCTHSVTIHPTWQPLGLLSYNMLHKNQCHTTGWCDPCLPNSRSCGSMKPAGTCWNDESASNKMFFNNISLFFLQWRRYRFYSWNILYCFTAAVSLIRIVVRSLCTIIGYPKTSTLVHIWVWNTWICEVKHFLIPHIQFC